MTSARMSATAKITMPTAIAQPSALASGYV